MSRRRRRAVSSMLIGMVVAACVGGGGRNGRLRIMILTGKNNHAWQLTSPVLRDLYADSGRFEVEILDGLQAWKPEKLEHCDVFVSNWTNYPSPEREWGQEREDALLAFIESGGGFVLVHAAGACFPTWPEYQELIGANWVPGTGHGPYHEIKVRIEDADHPVTKGMTEFTVTDELWHRMRLRPPAHVLLKAFSEESQGGTGRWEPAAVCTNFGGGRCFYLILGHDPAAMLDPDWKALMLRGTEWAATGEVTIGLPVRAR